MWNKEWIQVLKLLQNAEAELNTHWKTKIYIAKFTLQKTKAHGKLSHNSEEKPKIIKTRKS